MTDVQSYWNSRASGWHKLAGTPLLLNAAELQAIKDHAPQGAKKVLVLGATPPLHDVAPGAHVTCVDIAVDIIKLAQRPDITYHVCSWLDMPIEGYDFVVGCGSLNMIRWRDEYVRLFDRLRTNRIAVRVYDPEVIRTRKSVARFVKAVELMDSSHNVVLADLYKAGHDEYEHDFGAVYSFPPMEELIKLARGYDYSCQVAMSDEQHFPILKLTR